MQTLKLHSSIPGRALVGRVNPQEQSGVWGSLGHTGEAVPLLGGHLVEAAWVPQRQGPNGPGRTTTFASAGTMLLAVNPGDRCVL